MIMKNNVQIHTLSQPSLFIGLGGTGVDTLRMLKHALLEKGESIPPHIQFLGIDTTSQGRKNKFDILGGDEFITAQVREPEKYVSRLLHHPIQEWWPGIRKTRNSIHSGAGQVRAVGRLALHKNLQVVKKAIKEKIDRIAQINVNAYRRETQLGASNVIHIYIVCSLCGGTGSGMFLDVSLLCQHFLDRRDSKVTGIFLLPEIFAHGTGTNNIYANTYAALLELDHIMSISENNMETVAFSHDFALEVDNPPFDWIYMVDKQSEKAGFVNDLDTLKHFIAEELQLMLLSEIGDEEGRMAANLINQMDTEQGKLICYSGFGHCLVEKVEKDVGTSPHALANKLVEQLIQTTEAGEKEVDDICAKHLEAPLFNVTALTAEAGNILENQQRDIIEMVVNKKRQGSTTSISGPCGWKIQGTGTAAIDPSPGGDSQ